MSTWFYYDNKGQKLGPVSGGQLKGLAKAGMITPETIVETESGRRVLAEKIQGLTFVEPVQHPPITNTISHEPLPPVSTVAATPSPPRPPAIEIVIDGTAKTVTKQEVFDLAAQGAIDPDTPIRINGNLGKAGQVKGITFGQQWITDELFPFSESSSASSSSSTTTTTSEFDSLSSAGTTLPAESVASPFARVARPSATPFSFPGLDGGLVPAILAGTVVSVVCALIWAGITAALLVQIGWMAVGIGVAVGYTVRFSGRGGTPIYGILAAGLSMFGCVFGNLLATALIAANSSEINTDGLSTTAFLFYFFLGLMVQPWLAFQILAETFAPIDLLFYALALYLGFKTALTDMPIDPPPRRPIDGKVLLFWIAGIGGFFVLVVIISIAAQFAGNTGLSKKAIQNARSNPNPYLERRANFTTKLTKTGKAPQEWDNDPLPPGIEKVNYPSGNFQLEAYLFVPPNGREQKNPALVFFHGGFAIAAKTFFVVMPL